MIIPKLKEKLYIYYSSNDFKRINTYFGGTEGVISTKNFFVQKSNLNQYVYEYMYFFK